VSSRLRTMTARCATVIAAAAAFTVLPATAAHAETRCNSNGTPNWESGRFYNNSNREFKVTGDRRRSNGTWETVSVFVYPGQEAYATHRICDADFYYNYFRTWNWVSGVGYMAIAPYTTTKIGMGATECHTQEVRSGGTVTREPFCKH
jgi:hypothetical protein